MEHQGISDLSTFVALAARDPLEVMRLAEDQWCVHVLRRSPVGDDGDVCLYLEKARGGRRTWKSAGAAVEFLLAQGVEGFRVVDTMIHHRAPRPEGSEAA